MFVIFISFIWCGCRWYCYFCCAVAAIENRNKHTHSVSIFVIYFVSLTFNSQQSFVHCHRILLYMFAFRICCVFSFVLFCPFFRCCCSVFHTVFYAFPHHHFELCDINVNSAVLQSTFNTFHQLRVTATLTFIQSSFIGLFII